MYRSRLRPTQRAALLAVQATPEGRAQLLLPFTVDSSAAHGVSAAAITQLPFAVDVVAEQPPTGVGVCVLTSEIVSAQGYALTSVADLTIPFYVTGVGVASIVGVGALSQTISVTGEGACSVAGNGLFSVPFDIDTAAQAGFDGMTWGTVGLSVQMLASGSGIAAVVASGSARLKLEATANGAIGAIGAATTIIRPVVYGRAVRGVFGSGSAALRLVPVAHGKLGNSASSEWQLPLAAVGTGVVHAVFTGTGVVGATLDVRGVGSTPIEAQSYDTIFVSTRSPRVYVLEAA